MARGELFRAVPGAAFRRLRWAGLDHAKVVKPAHAMLNTAAGEGLRPFDPEKPALMREDRGREPPFAGLRWATADGSRSGSSPDSESPEVAPVDSIPYIVAPCIWLIKVWGTTT